MSDCALGAFAPQQTIPVRLRHRDALTTSDRVRFAGVDRDAGRPGCVRQRIVACAAVISVRAAIVVDVERIVASTTGGRASQGRVEVERVGAYAARQVLHIRECDAVNIAGIGIVDVERIRTGIADQGVGARPAIVVGCRATARQIDDVVARVSVHRSAQRSI